MSDLLVPLKSSLSLYSVTIIIAGAQKPVPHG
jgi:hypothetical protein